MAEWKDGKLVFRYQPEPYKWVEDATVDQLPDRVLIAHYLHYWDNRHVNGYALERGTISPELRKRGYDPTDVDDLRRRLT